MPEEFNDEESEENLENSSENGEIKIRVKLPRGEEVIGIIEQRLGGNKMLVNCLDGKTRNCRVPGRLKRQLWLRPGDVVIIEPWELDKEKGDVIFKYRPGQVDWLRRKGYLEAKSNEF
ncbi:MAG: translation initiation factor eIF-1A [Nanoarchaeota archaeon]|nr:translation initiation factor eIF-1A [Nanoarchaeota archaeon]